MYDPAHNTHIGDLTHHSEWTVQMIEEDVMVRIRSLEELLNYRVEWHQGMLQTVHNMMDNIKLMESRVDIMFNDQCGYNSSASPTGWKAS